MRSEYDFSKMKGRKNRFVHHLKKQITIRLGQDIIFYFKSLSRKKDIPYQVLINNYLRDGIETHKDLNWKSKGRTKEKVLAIY
jgi:uncharacterized protein (DUF4415 family)